MISQLNLVTNDYALFNIICIDFVFVPHLISKLVKKLIENAEKAQNWVTGWIDCGRQEATAAFNFFSDVSRIRLLIVLLT